MNLPLAQRQSELSESLVKAFPRERGDASTRRSRLRRRESGSPYTSLPSAALGAGSASKLPHSQSGLGPRGARCAVVAIIAMTSLFVAGVAFAQEKASATRLIELAKSNSAELRGAISATFDAKELSAGMAWAGQGPEFFFATNAAAQPSLMIDDAPGPRMQALAGSDLWYAAARIEPVGRLHSFYYMVNGTRFGGRLDLPAFGPLSYLQPGAPSGVLSEKIVHTSKIYDGMKSEYWIYVPAQYDPKTPAALMVFQDGGWYTQRDGNIPVLNAIDNLIAQKKIPVMICVFIFPGRIGDSPGTPTYNFVKAYSDKWHRTLDDSMRSTLYDTVSDRYARFLRDEVLADVAAKYNIRKDAYSHAITGLSSGGICSFNAAWQMPDEFSRVISWIGSFTSIQWKEDPNNPDGGQDYPDKVLREPKRNIRVWLQDGSTDMEQERYGSWPLANVRMANALKLKEYDFHFSFGKGTHNPGQGTAEFPEEMIWLWRDYDSSKTAQTYEMEAAEKAKPVFRVTITGRDSQ
jgi:enterochelin esterase-like enzyme